MDVVVLDYWFARSSDPSRSDHRYSICASTPVPAAWPNISILPEGLGSRFATSLGHRDIEFELESFNRAFEVRSGDQRFVHALIDARMMTWLQELPPGTGFEILDGTLLCRTPRRADDDATWTLETMVAFLERVPPVIESLFGSTR
jgi:hypothetical protein